MKNTFYLGMALKAAIFTGAVAGFAYSMPVLAEEGETPAVTEVIEENAEKAPLPMDEATDAIEEIVVEENVEEPAAVKQTISDKAIEGTKLEYQAHVANVGWQAPVAENYVTGTTGRGFAMEAIKIDVDSELAGSVEYSTYSSATGWSDNAVDNQMSGTTGIARPIEAVKINLTDQLAEYYSVFYRAHVSNIGWMGWTSNGNVAGTVGYGNQLEALQLKLIRKGKEASPSVSIDAARVSEVSYQTHVANIGWQAQVAEGQMAGTTGRGYAIEAVNIQLHEVDGKVKYETLVDGKGWTTKRDGAMAGTTGQSRPIHALRISLEGKAADEYDIFYRAHVSNIGWMDWVSNGALAGVDTNRNNIEALQIELREKVVLSAKEEPKTNPLQFAEGSAEKAALDIYNAFNAGEKKATVEIVSDHKLTYNELEKIDNTYIPGMPFAGDVFNMRFGTTFSSKAEEKDGKVINTVTYTVYQDRITSDEQKLVEQTLDKLFADNNVMAMSDYKKACFIYDWLVSNMTYTESNKHYSDYYGAIVDHKGTCDAYASAVYVMAQKAGLESRRMITRQHAWNIIEVDGKWYCLDATWGGRSQGHRFFFLNSEKDFGHEAEFADQKSRNTNNYKIYSSYDISPTSYPQEY